MARQVIRRPSLEPRFCPTKLRRPFPTPTPTRHQCHWCRRVIVISIVPRFVTTQTDLGLAKTRSRYGPPVGTSKVTARRVQVPVSRTKGSA